MTLKHRRLVREQKTLAAMLRGYCRDHHVPGRGLCVECQGLLDYATQRLERCPFQQQKPTCVKCPIHCYHAAQREQVRIVMRYAGPKMLVRHPILAVRHLLDGYRKAPDPKRQSAPQTAPSKPPP